MINQVSCWMLGDILSTAGHGLTISKENDEDFLLVVDNGFYSDASGKGKSQHGNVVKTDLKGRIIFFSRSAAYHRCLQR